MVKQGYKQTEIGIIPKDWSLSCLEKHMKIETGSRNTEHRNENGNIRSLCVLNKLSELIHINMIVRLF